MKHTDISSATATAVPVTADIQEVAETPAPKPKPKPFSIVAKAHVDREGLLSAVATVMRAIERRNTIPILANVALRAAPGGLAVTGTDLDLQMSTLVHGEVAPDFAITVPAHMLAKVLKEAHKGSAVTLTATVTGLWANEPNEDGSPMVETTHECKMLIRMGRVNITLDALPITDFPNPERGKLPHEFAVPTADLLRCLSRTEFAISTEETRYYLNGAYMHVFQDSRVRPVKIRFVTTDGHRMAVADMPAPAGVTASGRGMFAGVIIPAKTVHELIRLCKVKGAPDHVAVALSGAQVEFKLGDVTVLSKLVDGTFPDYQRVVPLGNDKVMAVDVKETDQAIAQVNCIASERGRAVKFSLRTGALKLKVENPDAGKAEMEIEADYEGDEMDIGFNSIYVRDILAQVESDVVEFRLADPGSPTLIAGRGADDDGVMYVLMPMRV